MKRSLILMMIACGTLLPATVFAYGEGEDISMDARAIHLLTNEARTNTREALATCGSNCSETLECYPETLPPLYWNDGLYRAAQFHANMLTSLHCMQHDSPCTLVSTVATDFPDACDGNPSCACVGGTASCGSVGTKTFARIQMFASGASSENLASAIGAAGSFDLWLFEDGEGSGCEFTMSNGHRWNILSSESKSVGVGYASYIASQDFGWNAPETSVLTAGANYTKSGTTWFKTHYYHTVGATKVTLKLADQCIDLSKTRGTDTNGVWGTSEANASGNCVPYYFEAKDANGTVTRFPTTGSLLYNCDKSWTADAAESCFASENGGNNEPGENGGAGENGGNGENGGTGENGENGGTGENGENGGTGENGENGGTGVNGENGGTGENGENGGTGENGENGGTGESGGNDGNGGTESGENHEGADPISSNESNGSDGCSASVLRPSHQGLGMIALLLLGAIPLLRRKKYTSL